MDAGQFYPELALGAGELPYAKRRAVTEFFVELVRKRGFPLHVNNLWNALYFTYDLPMGGFAGKGIELDRIPSRTMGSRDDALPVGAFVRVTTKTKVQEMWAEVVYKEGRHPAVTEQFVPPEVSGAPAKSVAEPTGSFAAVREALVLDYDAFGRGWNDFTPEQYGRIRRKAHWVDGRGHLVFDAIYPADQAELDDCTLYARYLFEQHRDGLLAFALEERATDQDVWAALLQSFATVAELAGECPGLTRWRDYYFDSGALAARVKDEDGPFGRWAMEWIFGDVATAGPGSLPIYTAAGPVVARRVAQTPGAAAAQSLDGTGYSTAVCHANAYVLARTVRDARGGLLPSGVHLRLDDDWQMGGIWRAERVASASNSSLLRVPPDIPLGLGYASSRPAQPAVSDFAEVVERSATGWRVTMTAGAIARGQLRLSAAAAAAARDARELAIRVRHDGEASGAQAVTLDAGGTMVSGVEWPLGFFPGIYALCQIERAGEVIGIRTETLAAPMVVDGDELRFSGDAEVYALWKGLRPDSPVARPDTKSSSLRDLIAAAFRSRGRQVAGDGRELTARQLVECVLGAGASGPEAAAVFVALEGMDLERSGDAYIWHPSVTRETRASDQELLAAYGEGRGRRHRRLVRRNVVPMHLRWLEGWKAASYAKEHGYGEARVRARVYGILPPDLPDGYTWVREFSRGPQNTDDEPFEEMLATSLNESK